MSGSYTITPSDHESTAARLIDHRGLEASWVSRAKRFDVDKFFDMLQIKPVKRLKEKLKGAFEQSYSNEKEFSINLLATLRSCVGASFCGEHQIVLTQKSQIDMKKDREFAIGFASEVERSQLGFNADNKELMGAKGIRYDHSCVVFERWKYKNGNASDWKVRDVVASVELKMNDTNCKTFNVKPPHDAIDDESIDLAGKHGALGQEIANVLFHVMHCRARLGLELTSMPLAVVATKRRGYNGSKRVCWVRGNLLVPKKCGEGFHYNVDDFGKFCKADHALAAMAAYLYVMTDGLKAAKEAIEKLTSEEDVATRSVSGQKLYFGNVYLDKIMLFASPIPSVVSDTTSKGSIFTDAGNQNKAECTMSMNDERKVTVLQKKMDRDARAQRRKASTISDDSLLCDDYSDDNKETNMPVKSNKVHHAQRNNNEQQSSLRTRQNSGKRVRRSCRIAHIDLKHDRASMTQDEETLVHAGGELQGLSGYNSSYGGRSKARGEAQATSLTVTAGNSIIALSQNTRTHQVSNQGKTEPIMPSKDEVKMKVSQGELYRGTMSFETRLNDTTKKTLWRTDLSNDIEERNILVKVTSIACHNLFTRPDRSYLWYTKRESTHWENFSSILSGALYAIYHPSAYGLVQLMPDLSKEGFKVLHPRHEKTKLHRVWLAFEKLVENVLIPLASLGLVHPDIRPGYNYTANILYRDNGEEGEMRLIDLDTICEGCCDMVQNRFLKGIDESEDEDITRSKCFVFWQVVTMASYWWFELDKKSSTDIMDLFIYDDIQDTFGISKKWIVDIKKIVEMTDQTAQLREAMAYFENAFANK